MNTSLRPYLLSLAAYGGVCSRGVLLENWQIPYLEGLVKTANGALQENSAPAKWVLRHIRANVLPLWSICKTLSDPNSLMEEGARLAQVVDITAKASLSPHAWQWVYFNAESDSHRFDLHSNCVLASQEHAPHIHSFFEAMTRRLLGGAQANGLPVAELIDERSLLFAPLLESLDAMRLHLVDASVDTRSTQFDWLSSDIRDFMSAHATPSAPAVRVAVDAG